MERDLSQVLLQEQTFELIKKLRTGFKELIILGQRKSRGDDIVLEEVLKSFQGIFTKDDLLYIRELYSTLKPVIMKKNAYGYDMPPDEAANKLTNVFVSSLAQEKLPKMSDLKDTLLLKEDTIKTLQSQLLSQDQELKEMKELIKKLDNKTIINLPKSEKIINLFKYFFSKRFWPIFAVIGGVFFGYFVGTVIYLVIRRIFLIIMEIINRFRLFVAQPFKKIYDFLRPGDYQPRDSHLMKSLGKMYTHVKSYWRNKKAKKAPEKNTLLTQKFYYPKNEETETNYLFNLVNQVKNRNQSPKLKKKRKQKVELKVKQPQTPFNSPSDVMSEENEEDNEEDNEE